MAISRGKAFEEVLKKAFMGCPGVSIDRLRDPTMGQLGVKNFCDFIVYKKPLQHYFECKAVSGNTLNFSSHISEYQWAGLLEKSKIPGVVAGVIVWFTDRDVTLFMPIEELERMRVSGKKSLNVKEALPDEGPQRGVFIKGKKKRVFFEYNVELFLEELCGCLFF